jgi:hypothetical protein
MGRQKGIWDFSTLLNSSPFLEHSWTTQDTYVNPYWAKHRRKLNPFRIASGFLGAKRVQMCTQNV